MIIQRSTLDSILLTNVCDIRFVRKIPKAGAPPTRRMLCTKSYSLLNSTNGRITLNYRPPVRPSQINEAKDNIINVWDILMQSYRNINMGQCDLIEQIPAAEEFWTYFNDNIYPMSAEQKANFMNT
tara:strand:+ start:21825 stop:22202 length:378 start_codon:yes stop_codon:yes gene_type:complete